jgi:hypothetical protein
MEETVKMEMERALRAADGARHGEKRGRSYT